jgi:formylglycine-generating enzyme required for sulfatase activity
MPGQFPGLGTCSSVCSSRLPSHPDLTDGRPVHRVELDGFWIDRTEVTNAEFARFVDATGCVTTA